MIGKSQAERIQEIGLGAWLDEPMDLDEFYGAYEPSRLTIWFRALIFKFLRIKNHE